MKLGVRETETEVVVTAEPFGSVTLNLLLKTVEVNLLDEVPWNTFVKINRELKRAISRNNKARMDFDETD